MAASASGASRSACMSKAMKWLCSMRMLGTPGEVSGSGGRMLAWFAALLVLGLIGVLVYLGLTN